MKHLLITLLVLAFSINAHAFPKERKTLAEEIAGTWEIKNVQKMQGMVIRTQKYTKDGGDSKAYIKRFKGCMITFNMDSTVVIVSAVGNKTYEGKWEFIADTKYRVKTGTGAVAWDNGHTESLLNLKITFPTRRGYNIEGEYKSLQFGVKKAKGKFSIVDPKYMFKFEKVEEEGDNTNDEK